MKNQKDEAVRVYLYCLLFTVTVPINGYIPLYFSNGIYKVKHVL